MQTFEIDGRSTPPEWAVRQRHLVDQMNRAAPRYVEKYTREDGTFIWRDEWPGMDGSDDGYEAYTFLHYFGLADPERYVDRQRALSLAAMYMGEDPEAPNWDPEHQIIRSPINGGAGPCFKMTAEDWYTHRGDLSRYPAPMPSCASG